MDLKEFKQLNEEFQTKVFEMHKIDDFKTRMEFDKCIEPLASKLFDFIKNEIVGINNLNKFICNALKENNYRYYICEYYEVKIYDDCDFGYDMYKINFKFDCKTSYTLVIIRH